MTRKPTYEELEQRVKELEKEAIKCQQAEEEKKRLEAQLQYAKQIEAIATLSIDIAHDLNNILTPIIVQTEMALSKISVESYLSVYLEHVLRAGQRATGLVQQILTLGRQIKQDSRAVIMHGVLDSNEGPG